MWKGATVKKWETQLRGGANCEMEAGGKYEGGRGNEKERESMTFLFCAKDQQHSANIKYRFMGIPKNK